MLLGRLLVPTDAAYDRASTLERTGNLAMTVLVAVEVGLCTFTSRDIGPALEIGLLSNCVHRFYSWSRLRL
jgi:hypothetical protein